MSPPGQGALLAEGVAGTLLASTARGRVAEVLRPSEDGVERDHGIDEALAGIAAAPWTPSPVTEDGPAPSR
ncbi:MAG: hypothetical protein JJT89_03650 [Nitriliruptoraceae bacterium]|nr:hypothetical protein [Nitriliruptoraceae bacterium]